MLFKLILMIRHRKVFGRAIFVLSILSGCVQQSSTLDRTIGGNAQKPTVAGQTASQIVSDDNLLKRLREISNGDYADAAIEQLDIQELDGRTRSMFDQKNYIGASHSALISARKNAALAYRAHADAQGHALPYDGQSYDTLDFWAYLA
jgi:hypothetical protein